MEIVELNSLSNGQTADLLGLMKELNEALPVTPEMLRRAAGNPATHLFAALENGHIVGTSSLCITQTPTGQKGKIEDVVVSSSCRGMGLGRQLMEHALNYARAHYAPIELSLTSNPSREAANRLYRALGFTYYETNVYKLEIQ